MTRTIVLVTTLLAVGAMTTGCSKGNAKTPKEAVLNFSKAIEKNDKDLFLASLDCTGEDRDFLASSFDSMALMADFAKQYEKAYGKDETGEMASGKIPTADEIESKAKFTEDGDKATASIEGKGSDLKLVRKDGVWKITMTDLPPKADREKVKKGIDALAGVLKDMKPKIGKLSKEEFTKEMGKQMAEAMKKTGE